MRKGIVIRMSEMIIGANETIIRVSEAREVMGKAIPEAEVEEDIIVVMIIQDFADTEDVSINI